MPDTLFFPSIFAAFPSIFITHFSLVYAMTKQLTCEISQLHVAFIQVHWPAVDAIACVYGFHGH
jgi:hypothetical protein